jgi:hypothetical protein
VIRDKKYKVVHNFSLLDTTLTEVPENDSSFVLTISGMSDEEQVVHTITLPSKDLKLLWVYYFCYIRTTKYLDFNLNHRLRNFRNRSK